MDGDMLLYHEGTPQPSMRPRPRIPEEQPRGASPMRFHTRTGRCTMWASDLTYEYVRLNADYTT